MESTVAIRFLEAGSVREAMGCCSFNTAVKNLVLVQLVAWAWNLPCRTRSSDHHNYQQLPAAKLESPTPRPRLASLPRLLRYSNESIDAGQQSIIGEKLRTRVLTVCTSSTQHPSSSQHQLLKRSKRRN